LVVVHGDVELALLGERISQIIMSDSKVWSESESLLIMGDRFHELTKPNKLVAACVESFGSA